MRAGLIPRKRSAATPDSLLTYPLLPSPRFAVNPQADGSHRYPLNFGQQFGATRLRTLSQNKGKKILMATGEAG